MDAPVTMQPMFAPWAILCIAIAAGFGTHFYYRGEDLAPRRRAALAVLRGLALAVLVLILLGPVVQKRRSVKLARPLCVVIDVSSSMAEADVDAGAPKTRLDAARDALAAALPQLADEYDLKIYALGDRAVPLGGPYVQGGAVLPRLQANAPSTALGDGLLEAAPRAAGGAMLLFSDGASNAGGPPLEIARELARRGVKVYTVCLGQSGLPNVAVRRVLGPKLLLRGEPSALFAEITQSSSVAPVKVSLKRDGKAITSAQLPPAAGLVRLDFVAEGSGDVRYVVEASAVPGEADLADNAAERVVRIAQEKLKVFCVEDQPRWEYRFIKNAVLRDERLEASLLLLAGDKDSGEGSRQVSSFPHDRAALFEFDCVVVGDVSADYFLPADLDNLRAFVSEGGGGVLFIAGANYNPSRYAAGVLAELVPADFVGIAPAADGLAVALTDAGAANPALSLSGDDQKAFWPTLPKLLWCVAARPRAGAVVLAETVPGGNPLIVEQAFGRGRTVLIATDELWRWRSLGGDRYLYRLWAQLVRYLGARRLWAGTAPGELSLSADLYPLGATVEATAYLENGLGMPLEDSSVEGYVEDASGARKSVRFLADPSASGIYRASLIASTSGRFVLHARSAAGTISAPFAVSDKTAEMLSRQADPATLASLAAATGGKVLSPDRLLDIISLYPPEKTFQTRRTLDPLWASWWALFPLVAALSLEWHLRKRWGLM